MDSERAGSQTECRAHCSPHGGVTLTDFYQKPEQGLVPDVQALMQRHTEEAAGCSSWFRSDANMLTSKEH